MKRLLLFALLLTAVACGKDEEPTLAISLSSSEAVLRSDIGSTASIIVTADDAWTLSASNSIGYTITPQSGSRGQTTVTLTATQQNTQKTRQMLGEVHFMLTYGTMSCSLSVVQGPGIAPQTMLLYMPGTSLSGYFKKNIEAIEAAVTAHIPGDGRILVCYQPKGNNKAELLEIAFDNSTQKSRTTTIKEYDQFAANEIASVQRLLADMALAAPAQRYGLSIGCHGKAWIPANAGMLSRRNRPHDANSLGTPHPDALPTRSFGDFSYQLDIPDLATAIGNQNYKLDYLIFDACFMANIETLYDLRNVVDAVIASPCEIMAVGFPYSRIIPSLFTHDGASRDLQKVCTEFHKFYNEDWNTVANNARSGCISLANTADLESLAEVMRRINATTPQSYPLEELQSYEGCPTHVFYDLGHYVMLRCGDAALRTEFTQQFDKNFPEACRLHTPTFYSGYGETGDPKIHPVIYYSGVSVSEPSTRFTVENQQTAWYRATH